MAKYDIVLTPARVLWAPVGETIPDETSVAYAGSWGGNWKELGRTLKPVVVQFQKEKFTLETEQDILPVREVVTKFNAGFKTTIAEWTGEILALVLDATKSTTAAGAGQKAYDAISIDGTKADISTYAFGIEGFRLPSTGTVKQPVRIFFKVASIVADGDVELAKAAGAGIAITVVALAEDSGIPIIIHNITAPATS